jgi:hypothetical protein
MKEMVKLKTDWKLIGCYCCYSYYVFVDGYIVVVVAAVKVDEMSSPDIVVAVV